MYNRWKSKSTIKTWINAKLRKILLRSFTKLIKIMCNTWKRFWKKLGNCSGPEHFKSPCAAVPRHYSLHFFSQEAGVLLVYVKPLVRNCYCFYMSDPINAVYNNLYPVVSIRAGKWVPKDPYKSPKCWRDAQQMITQDFSRSYQLSQKLL